MDVAFFRGVHENEHKRKDSLAQRASAVTAALTTLTATLAYLVNNQQRATSFSEYAFWILAALSSVALATGAFFLIRSYQVPFLSEIDKPDAWLRYWEDLLREHGRQRAVAQEVFSRRLIQVYAQVASENIEANTARGQRLVRSNNSLLVAFPLIVACGLLHVSGNAPIVQTRGVAMDFATGTLVCTPAQRASNTATEPGTRKVPDTSPVKPPPQ